MPSSDACRDVRAATRQADGIRGKIANDAVVLAGFLSLSPRATILVSISVAARQRARMSPASEAAAEVSRRGLAGSLRSMPAFR
jgi:hypothetical protein